MLCMTPGDNKDFCVYVWGWCAGLQVLEMMAQLNQDAVYEVEQINERIANINICLKERTEKLAKLESALGDGRGGKQGADELMNELEHEKRDQDNRWECWLFICYPVSEVCPEEWGLQQRILCCLSLAIFSIIAFD